MVVMSSITGDGETGITPSPQKQGERHDSAQEVFGLLV